MSKERLTADEIRDLLAGMTEAMLDHSTTDADWRPGPLDGPRLNTADSRGVAVELHEFFRHLPPDDPRLVLLASRGLSFDQFVDMVPDDGKVPATGDGMLAYLIERLPRAGRAKRKRKG